MSRPGTSLCITRGPSAYVSEAAYQNNCYECDEDDIAELIEQYVLAAKRAVDAGFDYIEVIGSESSLPAQFLMSMYNKRRDRWGGSLENRARFWLEVLSAIKRAVGDDAAIGTRIAIDNLMGPAGLELEGEGLPFVELITREGATDLWNIKLSFFMEWGNDAGPSRFFKAGYQTWSTKAVKAVAKVPVVGVNRVTEPDAMVRMIEGGEIDLIGAARPSIADPFLPRKIEEGRADDIRECIGCNICISQFALDGPPLVCTQNATAMEEYRRGWHPEKFAQTKEPCSVLVVGAGPAGLECARVLGMRGYDVHLREAESEVGGHIRYVSRYPGLSEWGRVVSYRENQIAKLGNVEVHTGVGKMAADDILSYGADKIVVAVGAHWATDGVCLNDYGPALTGADASLPQFCTPEQVMAGKETGERVVVVDGDGYFTGAGMAEYLADQGKTVSMVTQFGEVAPYTALTLESPNLQRMLHDKGVATHLLYWVEAIDLTNGVELSLAYAYRDGAEFTLPPKAGVLPRRAGTEVTKVQCDTVVLVTSRVSNRELFSELKARKADWQGNGVQAVYETGDGQTPRFIQMSIFEAHRMAREFETANPQKPLDYIRERQIWGQEAYPSLDA